MGASSPAPRPWAERPTWAGPDEDINTSATIIPFIEIVGYDLHFGRSTYAQKAKEITFPMALVPCLIKIKVARNHQNNTDF
jgi:hypothetical protein